MKELGVGDPLLRSADHGEAYGASIKDSIHRRCLRRKKATAATVHKRRGADGQVVKQWTQRALSVSRVMQTWQQAARQLEAARPQADS